MRSLLAVLLLSLVACSDDDSSGPDGDDFANIDGSWTWAADVANSELQLSCLAAGSATINQTGDQFNGTITGSSGSCTGPEGTFPFDSDGPIGGGFVEGNSVSFDDNFCDYTGVATGNPINEVDGEVTCVFPISGQDVTMVGTWEMQR